MNEDLNTEIPEADDFDLAFESISAGEDLPLPEDVKPKSEPEPEPKGDPEPEPKPEPKGDPEPEPKPEPKGDPEPEPKPEPKIDPDEIARKAAERLKADQAAQKAEDDKAAARALSEEFTAEEQEIFTQVKEDFPEVFKVLEAQKRILVSKMQNMYEAKVAELISTVDSRINPAISTVQTIARNDHERAILTAHPDALDKLPEVEKWIKTQPKIAQPAYNKVLDAGSAPEIIELFTEYKNSLIIKPEEQKDKPLPKDKQKKLESMEGVKGHQTNDKVESVPSTFDDAFDKFAAIM